MTLFPDMKPCPPHCASCDRLDLLRIAFAAGSQSDLSLEWMLDRTPRPQFRMEGML